MKQFRDTEYYVTEDGKVYSKKFGKMRELKLFITKAGYLKVGLSKNGVKKTYLVHRLVAEVYLPNPNNFPIVEHKDDIKTNNNVSNLMWSNVANNNKHAYENGLILKGEKHPSSKLTEEQVKCIRKSYIRNHREFGGGALSKKFNVNHTIITDIINKKLWKHI